MIRSRCILVMAVCLASCFFVFSSRAADDASSLRPIDAPQDFAGFRRVFVPADSPESWPIGLERYLPIPNREFYKLLEEAVNEDSSETPLSALATRANYQLSVESSGVVRVRAELEVQLLGDEPSFLVLAPLNAIIEKAEWLEEPGTPALLGTWKMRDGTLSTAVRVEKTGTLIVEGLLARVAEFERHIDYLLSTPAIVAQHLNVVVPNDVEVTLSNANLLQSKNEESSARSLEYLLLPGESYKVRIKNPDYGLRQTLSPHARQVTSYEISQAGVRFDTTLMLDAHAVSFDELRAVMPPDVRVVDVTTDGVSMDWQFEETSRGKELAMVLPRSGEPRTVVVNCVALTRTGIEWKLPKLRFLDIAWTEGESQIAVSRGLEIKSIEPTKSSLFEIEGVSRQPTDSEVLRLREWSSDATTTILLDRPQSKIIARKLTSIQTTGDVATAEVVTELSTIRGEVYQFSAVIRRGWEVDSVKLSPSSALRDWRVQTEAQGAKLYVDLKRPIANGKPLQAEISLRKKSMRAVLPATVGQLRLLRLAGVQTASELLQLTTRKHERMRLSDRIAYALVDMSTQTLSVPNELQEFIRRDSDSILIDVIRLVDSQQLTLEDAVPRFTADVRVDVHVESDRLTHQFAIDCEVQSGTVSELRFETSAPLPDDLQWLLDENEYAVTMQRMPSLQVENGSPKLPRYVLRFPRPLTRDFKLVAQYSSPAHANESCILMRLFGTFDWSGRIILKGKIDDCQIVNEGLTSSLVGKELDRGSAESGEVIAIQEAYRIGPDEFRGGFENVKLRLVRKSGDGPIDTPRIFATTAEYQTLQAANGVALHAAVYSILNSGENVVSVVFPADVELQEAWFDDAQIDLNRITAEGSTYRFPLPQRSGSHRLALRYSKSGEELADSSRISPIIPNCSFRVDRSRWTLWAPERYAIDSTEEGYGNQRSLWWKRIFGPLARTRNDAVFNPLKASRWQELWSAPISEQKTRQLAGALANQLGERLEAEPMQTLGAVISAVAAENDPRGQLRIDQAAMLKSGINPATTGTQLIKKSGGRVRDTIRAKPLSSYGIALVASSESIVLTTAFRIAHWHDRIRPTRVPGVYAVTSDSLAASIGADLKANSLGLMAVDDWMRSPARTYALNTDLAFAWLADVGRQARSVDFIDEIPTLIVRRANVQQSLWYAMILLTIVLTVWQLSKYPNVMFMITASMMAICLAMPVRLLLLPQAIFIGLLCAAVVKLVLKLTRLMDQGVRSAAGTIAANSVVVIASFVVALSSADSVVAEQDHAELNPEMLGAQTILIPIDAKGRNQGGDVYLPERYLRHLRQASQNKLRRDGDAVIREAKYLAYLPTGTLAGTDEGERFANKPWTFLWKIESYVSECKFVLPIRRVDAAWDDQLHRLNGSPVQIAWDADGDNCTVNLVGAGNHTLELVCRPKLATQELTESASINVPRVSGAVLNLSVPSELSKVHVDRAVSLPNQETSSLSSYLLEPTEVVGVHWEKASDLKAVERWKSHEKVCWLRVDPESVLLNVQLSIQGARESMSYLDLDTSASLKILEPDEDSPVTEIVIPNPTRPNQIRLMLRRGLPTDFKLALQFELIREQSIGQIFYPSVDVVGAVPSSSLFAVSVATGLSYEESLASDFQTIESSEFLAAWGDSDSEPLYAYAFREIAPEWSLKVWPDPRYLSAQQSIRMFCSSKRFSVDYEANVDEVSGRWLVHRFQVPEPLSIDSVSIRDDLTNDTVPLRWSRASASVLSVFAARPIQGSHSVTIRGHIENQSHREIELPQIALFDDDRSEIHLDLYRSDDVEILWSQPELAPQKIDEERMSTNRDDIHVGHYYWRASQYKKLSSLRMKRNDQVILAKSVTLIEQQSDEWFAKINSRIAVQKGVVSRVHLAIPKEIQAPFKLDSDVASAILEDSDLAEEREVVVLLAKPAVAGDEISVSITASLDLPADRSLIVPSLYWKNVRRAERYVLLPTLSEGEPITWQHVGLMHQALPLSLVEVTAQDAPSLCYRLVQEQFFAKQRSSQLAMRNAQIRFAKISAFVDEGGSMLCTAEILLQPGRATSCEIQLPQDSELRQLVVGDNIARREFLANENWAVQLGPSYLPQRLVLRYHCRSPMAGDRLQFKPPRVILGDSALPAKNTWWWIQVADGLVLSPTTTESLSTEGELAETQFEVSLEVLQDAFSQVLDLPKNEGRAWAQTWKAIISDGRSSRQAMEGSLKGESKLGAAMESLLALEDAFVDEQDPFSTANAQLSYPTLWNENLETMAATSTHVLNGNPDGEVLMTFTDGTERNLWRWLAGLALVSGVLAIVLRLKQHPEFFHMLSDWPHALALVGGFTWWLLLNPSFVGFLIIVLAVLSLTIKRWRARNQENHNSSRANLVTGLG